MKVTRLHTLIALLLTVGLLPSYAQIVTEINYHNKYYHVPNTVCQSFDGSILVECTVSQNETIFGSRLLKFNRLGNCTDSLFNIVSEHPIATINGANVNYSNMQAVARLNNDEWLYSCRMGLQSDGEFYNQLTKFDNQLNYQADFQIHNEGTQGNSTSYPIPEGSVKVTQNGTIFHACMDYLMFFPGYLNISCLNPDLTLRWQYRYPDEPETPYGLNMCVLDDGTAVVCGYSRDDENDNYDMFLLLLENEGESITESENDIKVELYPNPGTNILTIKTTLPNSKIEIYDLNGKLIHNTEISHNVISINTESWHSGTYILKFIFNGQLVKSDKWLKQ